MSEAKPGAPDPSMEDILASIRKILNEDEQAPAAEPGPEVGANDDGPVLLTAEMMISPPEVPPMGLPVEPTPIQPEPQMEPQAMAEPLPEAAAPAEAGLVAPEAAGLVAPAAAAAAVAALGQLSRVVAQDRGAGVSRSGLSIEDVVREELRPLLKEWLDTHLPGITERLVRAEIERVMSRQG